MKMSSKTALIKALEIIELSENTDEKMLIIEQLNALIQEYSNTKWTKELIFKRIDEWVEINGVNPLHKDFQRKGLPKPITVEAHFNTKLSDFIKKYYPQNRKCINSKCSFSNQELIDIFIEQYNKIKPPTQRHFNIFRDKDTPTWNTISRRCSDGTWSGLLKLSNVDTKYLKKKVVYKKQLLSISESNFNSYREYNERVKTSSLKIKNKT